MQRILKKGNIYILTHIIKILLKYYFEVVLMSELSEEEKKFFEKIEAKEIKKISLNLNKETISKIDELAKIFRITRTLVMESIICIGLKHYLKIIESANKKLKAKCPDNEKLDLMLGNIRKFRDKWSIK
ncbi:hypothetical protein AUJ69_04390 [Candidatus Woesearchaeota archaeon CG1_02_47_18]|nr:MAG: hypothetical protein AUJ69_04390 [Candidatus Woesearchaeota archaeon CG1_02_47_18]